MRHYNTVFFADKGNLPAPTVRYDEDQHWPITLTLERIDIHIADINDLKIFSMQLQERIKEAEACIASGNAGKG
jgi:hypothetical protein